MSTHMLDLYGDSTKSSFSYHQILCLIKLHCLAYPCKYVNNEGAYQTAHPPIGRSLLR